MFKTKKAIEISFNTVVIAAICLIVLVVIIAIFTGQTGNIAEGFTKIREKGVDQSALDSVFGCDEGSKTCKGKAVYICRNDEFVEEHDCPDKCEKGACV